jgi:hypothetical protein
MISRNLAGRLKRLEDRMMPTGEPTIINVSYVNADGTPAPGGYQVGIRACSSVQDGRRRASPPRFANRGGWTSETK